MKVKRIWAYSLVAGMCLILTLPIFVAAKGVDTTNTIFVYPTGVDDTDNIEYALTSAGAGDIVQLVEGTYYLSRSVIVADFDGHFRGAGKGETVIEALDGFHVIEPHPYMNPRPPVFFFYQDGGDFVPTLRFSDMTVRVKGESDVGYYMTIFYVMGRMTGVADFEDSHFNAFFSNLDLQGEGEIYGQLPNVEIGIKLTGEYIDLGGRVYTKPIVGDYMVSDCSFSDMTIGVFGMGQTDSYFLVKDNRAEDIVICFLDLVEPSSTVTLVENNIMSCGWLGILMGQGFWNWMFGSPYLAAPSDVCITRNIITVETGNPNYGGGVYGATFPSWEGQSSMFNVEVSHNYINILGNPADGACLIDYSNIIFGTKSMNAVVTQNTISMEDTDYGGVFGLFLQDGIILNNRISGTGAAGIYSFGGSGWVIKGNNVHDVNAFVAPIWLGPGTFDCTVVGGSVKTSVLDWSDNPSTPYYDGYNILVGVNNMQGNAPGEDICTAMEQRSDMKKLFPGF
jgi:hypothetical protein